jgi:hypothetical protein
MCNGKVTRLLGAILGSMLAAIFVACGGGGGGSSRSDVGGEAIWTKTNTPGWATELPPEVEKMWRNLLNDADPLYTGLYSDGKSTKVFVSRSEWEKMNYFQARNNLLFAVLLPHTDETIIQFIDDKSGEQLAKFTPKQPFGTVKIVHRHDGTESKDVNEVLDKATKGSTTNAPESEAQRSATGKARIDKPRQDDPTRQEQQKADAERQEQEKAEAARVAAKAAKDRHDLEERSAAQSLDLAKQLIKAGKEDKAIERLKKIVAQFPGTDAAKEASELLQKL